MNNTELKKIKDLIKSNPGLPPGAWIDTLIFMLLWAKFLPQTENEAVGFFDVLNTLDSRGKLEAVLNKLRADGQGVLPDSIYFLDDRDIISEPTFFEQVRYFEILRSELLPVAKVIVTGTHKDIEKIIDLILEIDDGKGGPKIFSLNKGILDFSRKVFDNISESREINCLGPVGALAAYKFIENRNIFYFTQYDRINRFASSLLSVYGKKIINKLIGWEQREIAFVGFEWGSKQDWDSIPYFSEFLSNDYLGEWHNINDFQCKSIYLAHENTRDTTIAITNVGTLFSNNNGISHFRKKLIDNNWLETVIELPSNIFQSSAAQGALLILKKNRKRDDKIQFIDFTNCKNHDEAKRGTLIIPEKEIENLFKKYKNKKNEENSILVSADDIKSKEYNLSVRRYLLTEQDKEIKNILDKRKTVTLNSLVDFVRPLNYSSKNTRKGIEICEILISDINNIGEIKNGSKKVNVGEEFFSRSNLPLVKKNDLIISIKGTLGKIGIISSDLKNTIPGTSFCILRVHNSSLIDPEYLMQYLRSDICQRLIFSSSQGSTIPFLSIKDLKNLSIPIPSKKEQLEANKISKRSSELNISLEKMQNELNELTANGWLKLNKNKSKKNESQTSNWYVEKTQLDNYLNSMRDGLSHSKDAIQMLKIINDKYSQNIKDSQRLSDNDFKEAIFQIFKKSTESKQKLKISKEDSS